jgi:hypothetical protein
MPQSPDHTDDSDEAARDQEPDTFQFDGSDGTGNPRTTGSSQPCGYCGEPFHEHEKERVQGHAPGFYSYDYVCPT